MGDLSSFPLEYRGVGISGQTNFLLFADFTFLPHAAFAHPHCVGQAVQAFPIAGNNLASE